MNVNRMMAPMDMEAQLEKAFRPVRPSRSFVQTVRSRIRVAPSVMMADRINNTPRLLLLIGAVISATLLLAASARAVFYMLNKSKM